MSAPDDMHNVGLVDGRLEPGSVDVTVTFGVSAR